MSIDAQHRELLRTLARHRVDFVLVGGVGLQLRGATATTRDVDVTIAADHANAERLGGALDELQARPYLAGDRGTAYHTRYGQLEIMRQAGGHDYDAWAARATRVEVAPDTHVLVGTADELLRAKEVADRDKDRAALPLARADLLAAGEISQGQLRGPVADIPVPTEHEGWLVDVLGPRPARRQARVLWERAGQLIDDYRRRWQITDDGLGPAPPHESPQALDRASLDRQLQRLERMISRSYEPPSIER